MRSVLVLALLFSAGCMGPNHIDMHPEHLTFTRRGEQTWVHAVFSDSRGKSYPREATVWSSSNPKVATVDSVQKPGNVTAVGPGHAMITVKGAGLVGQMPVDVVTVEKLRVEPAKIELTVDGDRVPLTIRPLDSTGHVLSDRQAHLQCADPKICNCDGSGVWPAGAVGQTTVKVTVGDQSVTLPVVVTKGGTRAKKK